MPSWKLLAALVLSIAAIGCSCMFRGAAPPPRDDAGSADATPAPDSIEAFARTLPPLTASGGTLKLPLAISGPYAWRAIRDGISIGQEPSAIRVSYSRTRGEAAGMAQVIRPGTLEGLTALRIQITGPESRRLVVCLKDESGVVWSAPAFQIATNGDAPPRSIGRGAFKPDPYQNSAPVRHAFDPARVMMITVIDIGGYMSLTEPRCDWTIRVLEAETGAAPPPVGSGPSGAHEGPAPSSPPEAIFFDALNHHPERRAEAVAALDTALASAPSNGRLQLLAGLGHLWAAAEEPLSPEAARGELSRAESRLRQARLLLPGDSRIVSWLSAATIARAELEGDQAALAHARSELKAAYDADPCFHSVALGISRFSAPAGSPEFREGLNAMRSALECDPSRAAAQNAPRWPHNVEGFLVALSDYERKAGNPELARAMLTTAQASDSYDSWPFKSDAESRLSSLDTPRSPAPPYLFSPASAHSCIACHESGQ
jgi:hypothetical protein